VEKSLEDTCKQVVSELLAESDWQLVDDAESFARRVCQDVAAQPAGTWEQNARRAAISQYAQILYNTVIQGEAKRQERAAEELWKFLYGVVLYQTGDEQQAKEATQKTLMRLWQNPPKLRDPRVFFAWAKSAVLRELSRATRKQSFRLSGLASEDFSDRVADVSPPAYTNLLLSEDRSELIETIQMTLKSERQQAVIIGLYALDKTIWDVARELGTSPENVQVLKARALARLRENPEFCAMLENLLAGIDA
jgi:RNA polymerase sigma factor (sigma-70 family)